MKYTRLWQVSAVVMVALAVVMVALAAMVFALGAASAGGPLTISVVNVVLPLDRVGEVRDEGDRLEVRDRRYEGEAGTFRVAIDDTGFLADEIKVTSDLKVQGGIGEHRGTIEIDIDNSTRNGRITLEYRGTASVSGSTTSGFTIVSRGDFKVTETRGIFNGMRAEGSYNMTIVESGSTLGSSATTTISALGI